MEKTKKTWYKRWWAITMFVLIGVTILVSLFGESNNVSQPTQQKTETQNNAQITAQKPETKIYSVGEEIQAGDFKWKITGFTTTKQIGEEVMGTLLGEKADGIFLIIDVEIQNTGKSAQYLMDNFVKLVDNEEREFSPNTAAAVYLKPQGSALVFEQINPGITKKGKIVFDVPEGLKVVNVRISSNLIQSAIYSVKLSI